MDEQTTQLLKDLIPGLHIDKPILSARIKGNTLELFLYGGERLTLQIPDAGSAEAIQSAPEKKNTRPERKSKGKK